ncbi:SDR family NAD(P)-dependent oxidoreductase [Jeotgalibacillus marinus]|uniref:SDR family NAD(P)-dependent oxidoreductase n=1 Tax=Jeotgalibacillus marinus TaxID=86667 RepID=A0ABV3Q1V0_9BACL
MICAIVTGASKGLGAAIGDQLLENNIHLIDVSRSGNDDLRKKAEEHNLNYHHEKLDVSSTKESVNFLQSWFDEQTNRPPEKLYLIHNAGTVEPIETVGQLDADSVERSVHINYITPVLLTNIAFERTTELGISLTVVNVTSGAADKPNHGWSVYGSTKAALNLFTETAALEQSKADSEHMIISFSPSIMDTDMQSVIRSSSSSAFTQVERFKEFKEKGQLRQPHEVGKALVQLLMSEKLENGKLYHINDLL